MYKTFSKMALILCLTPAFLFAQTYKVVLNPNSPPKAFRDESGLFIGIDVDIIKAIAQSQGFEVEFFGSDKKLPTIDDGSNDIAPSIVITDDRKAKYGVSDSYFTGYTTALHKKALADNNLENLPSDRTAVVFDTNKHKLLKEAGLSPIKADTTFLGIAMVFQGKADYFVSDDSILKYTIKQNPKLKADLTNLMVHGVLEESHYGFVVKKDQTELLNKINAGLAEIKANGEFDKIVESWLGKAGN